MGKIHHTRTAEIGPKSNSNSHLRNKKIKFNNNIIGDVDDYKLLFDSLAQGVLYQDIDGNIIHANKAASRILGLTHEELIGRSATDPRWKIIKEDGSTYPNDQHPSILTLNTGKPVYKKTMAIFNPILEEYKWLLVDAEPLFKNDEAFPYRVLTSFIDITIRKNMELELTESQANLTTIIESTFESIWSVNKNYDIIYANKNFIEQYEKAYGVVLKKGKNTLANLSQDLKDLWKKRCDNVFNGHHLKFIDVLRIGDSDNIFEIVMNPINVNGKVCGAAVFSRDITQKQKHLLEIEKQNKTLKEIAWTQSHIVRAPLARIMGLAHLMGDFDHMDEEKKKILTEILNSAKELDQIIHDISQKTYQMDKRLKSATENIES